MVLIFGHVMKFITDTIYGFFVERKQLARWVFVILVVTVSLMLFYNDSLRRIELFPAFIVSHKSQWYLIFYIISYTYYHPASILRGCGI